MYIGTKLITATLVAMNLMVMSIPAIYAVGLIIGNNSQSIGSSPFAYGVSLQHSLTLVCTLMSVFVGMLVFERLDEQLILIGPEPKKQRLRMSAATVPVPINSYGLSRREHQPHPAYRARNKETVRLEEPVEPRRATPPKEVPAPRTPTISAPRPATTVPANNRPAAVAARHSTRAAAETSRREPRRETMVPPTPAPLSVRAYRPTMVPCFDTTYAGPSPLALGS
jgi:hypothetical protein